MEKDFFKVMNNIVYGKTIKKKMSFEMEKGLFKLMNNSVYDLTIKKNEY